LALTNSTYADKYPNVSITSDSLEKLIDLIVFLSIIQIPYSLLGINYAAKSNLNSIFKLIIF